ncbi:MAG: hypothetical protein WC774_03680 [Candidatus Gracilibacteria bacterium]
METTPIPFIIMRKLKIVTIFCLALIILGFGLIYSKNYRLAYEFYQNKGSYETLAKFMFNNKIIVFDRRPCYVFGSFGNMIFNTESCSSLEYSSENGAFNRDCDEICNLGNGITIDSLMIQIRAYDIHSNKYQTTPFDSLFFGIFDWDRTIGYKKGGWGDIKKGQTTYGGTFEYRIDNNWIILKDYDRDRNPKPEKYDY